MIHVIQSVASLAPETGGPARSVSNLSLALASLGVKVTILAVDLGKGFSSALIPDHELIEVVNVPVKVRAGLRPVYIPNLRIWIQEIASEKENLIIHDHGIWLPQNWFVCNYATNNQIPLVISPRGMLEPGALQQKRIKKKVALFLYQRNLLMQAAALHAASPFEAAHLRDFEIDKPVIMIPNGTDLPPDSEGEKTRDKNDIHILFLSRIHPIKGLLLLVESLGKIKSRDWKLTIAGYNENNHQADVEKAVREANLTDRVEFAGPVQNEEKWSYFRDADLFVLPSYSENFGIVVAEALAAGVPVITTTGTPWEELVSHKCGWWVEPTVEEVAGALDQAFRLSPDVLKAMGKRGQSLIHRKYTWDSVGKKMHDFYQSILEGSLEIS